MRLCYALLHYDRRIVDPDPQKYLAGIRAAHELPQALAARGHEVDVVHLYPFDGEVHRDGVRHRFVAPGSLARLQGWCLGRRRPSRSELTPAWRAIRRMRELRPDVVHFFGTSLHLNLALMRRMCRRDAVPVVLHHNGGSPARSVVGRRLQRYGFSGTERVFFTTDEQVQSFTHAGLVGDEGPGAALLMETSSRFRPRPRAAARRQTAMTGAPVFLWAARLHPLKDPMTALRGFRRIADSWPGARLYMHYLTEELLPDVRAWVGQHAELEGRVHFGGRLPYDEMEPVFNSADFLLQASRREHSGCAVLDAMACGVVPVVTDIPSFRAMTAGGEAGILFPPGDDESLARQVLTVPRHRIEERAAAVRDHFEKRMSFATLARHLERAYEAVTP